MSKVTRSKLKFLIYILLQETNKINRKFFQILNDFFRIHSSASRAFVTRKRFSACWGNSPIPIERCLCHRAAHPFRMLQRQFLPKKKSPVQHEHYTHTAPDFPSSTTLSIFFFLPHFLLMQLLFFLLVLFQDFLHNLLRHKPILHFRFGLAVLCIRAFLSFQKH